jgi:hypothetical protein
LNAVAARFHISLKCQPLVVIKNCCGLRGLLQEISVFLANIIRKPFTFPVSSNFGLLTRKKAKKNKQKNGEKGI